MLKLSATTAIIRDTRSGNAANGKRTRVKRSSNHRNKTVIVTVMLTVLVQQLRGL
jgi:hypothetical protein